MSQQQTPLQNDTPSQENARATTGTLGKSVDRLYSLIANEEDARICKDIPAEACHVVPRNFFLILAANVLTKLGDLLISPKTVLAWLMSAVGAPALVAWLVPIRESGSMVPQMMIAAWVRRKPVRKWFWTLGSFGQAVSVVAMAACVWFFEGYTAGGGNAIKEAFHSLSLLRDDVPFRNFVITRALLLCSALASPYFVVLAQKESDTALMLGVFLLASSLASSVSASFWGWMADSSSRRVMIRGAAIASGVCLIVGLTALVAGTGLGNGWFYPLAFFVLSIAHAGVRLGRKTYLVDMAGGNKRTDYTAVSNTVIGFLLLATGGFTALISLISDAAVILVLGLMGLAGTFSALRLKEVTDD